MAGLRRAALAMTVLAALAACETGRSTVGVGRAAFAENCSTCHGARARGDGPMAVFVATGVPDLRQLSVRNGGSFPRTHVVEVVTKISDLHQGIVAMPDFGALLDASPTVYTTPEGDRIATDATILAIADYLESIQD